MLKEFVENKHYIFVNKVENWEEAIKIGCQPIIEDGTVEASYAQQIIECVKKYGPYIVLMPNIAMPHSQEDALGVHKTTISFMKVEEPVHFDEMDSEKDARLFFTLASCNHEEHLENMMKLSEMLMNEALIADLLEAKSAEDLLKLHEKYM